MRFEIGDRFTKKPFAGFVAKAVPRCEIPDYDENRQWAPCMAGCDDDDCREFATCIALNPDGSLDGYLYHVSECQMQPIINSGGMYERALAAIDKLMQIQNPTLPVLEQIDDLSSRVAVYEKTYLPWLDD